MKAPLLSCFTILISSACLFSQNQQPDLYLNQKPPGSDPVLFAPGIISMEGRYEYGISFSPQLDEIFFSAETIGEGASVLFTSLKDGQWSDPKKTNFTEGNKKFEMEAFVSPDGSRIYFTAFDSMNVRIWYVNRSPYSWGKAQLVDLPVGNDIIFYSNAAANGDLYFTNYSKQGIYYAPLLNNSFPEVHQVDIEHGGHGFISPAQDYLLFDALKDNDNNKDRDIYVSFRMNGGMWSTPYLLGNNVNSEYDETCPSISPDGKYIFFSRYNEKGGLSNIYWIDAKILEGIRQKNGIK